MYFHSFGGCWASSDPTQHLTSGAFYYIASTNVDIDVYQAMLYPGAQPNFLLVLGHISTDCELWIKKKQGHHAPDECRELIIINVIIAFALCAISSIINERQKFVFYKRHMHFPFTVRKEWRCTYYIESKQYITQDTVYLHHFTVVVELVEKQDFLFHSEIVHLMFSCCILYAPWIWSLEQTSLFFHLRPLEKYHCPIQMKNTITFQLTHISRSC